MHSSASPMRPWWLAACLALALVSGCTKTVPVPPTSPDEPATPEERWEIKDLKVFPQNLIPYAEAAGGDQRLVSAQTQTAKNQRYDELFFAPWDQTRARLKARNVFEILGGAKRTSKPQGYAENLLRWTPERWNALADNANRRNYPNRSDKGITVMPTPLREAPTHAPRYAHPTDPGQGYPFDLFAFSTLPAGMPLFVSHASKDQLWLYVENALVGGWVPANHVAITDEAFRTQYRNGRYGAILGDDVPLTTAAGVTLTKADVGTILPLAGQGVALVPTRTTNGTARLEHVRLDAQLFAAKPLPLTPAQVARVGNVMLQQPYGWGGLLGNRDCSLMLRDLFAPFGIWLPRNSAAQAKSWSFRPLSGSTSAKEATILRQAQPFATLIWLKGHIGLYIGDYKGQATLFHSFWGIRTEPEVVAGRNVSGRFVIGRTVITSLQPGVDLPQADKNSTLLDRVLGMSVLEAK